LAAYPGPSCLYAIRQGHLWNMKLHISWDVRSHGVRSWTTFRADICIGKIAPRSCKLYNRGFVIHNFSETCGFPQEVERLFLLTGSPDAEDDPIPRRIYSTDNTFSRRPPLSSSVPRRPLEDKLHHILWATFAFGKVIPSWDHRGRDSRATSASQIPIE
jgi:hypothetical protein